MFLERLGRWCQWLWIHCVQNYFLKIFQPKECTKSNFCDNKKKREENYKVCDDYYLEVLLLEKTDEKRTTKASFSQAGVDLKVCEVTLVLEILCCSSLMIGWLAVSPSFSLQWRQFVSLINLLCILCPFFDRYQTINAIIECGSKKGESLVTKYIQKMCLIQLLLGSEIGSAGHLEIFSDWMKMKRGVVDSRLYKVGQDVHCFPFAVSLFAFADFLFLSTELSWPRMQNRVIDTIKKSFCAS